MMRCPCLYLAHYPLNVVAVVVVIVIVVNVQCSATTVNLNGIVSYVYHVVGKMGHPWFP